MSTVNLAKLFERAFNVEQDSIFFPPWIGLVEQGEGQRMAQATQEKTLQQTQTASGMGDDFDLHPQPQQQVQGPQ